MAYAKTEMLIVNKKEWTAASTNQQQQKKDMKEYIMCDSVYVSF